MTTYRLPALDWAAPITDPTTGRPTPYFQRFWQSAKITAEVGANQSSDITALQSQITSINGQISTINTTLGGKAPLASPAFTGTPTAPTAAGGTNSTQIATTAYVVTAISTKANLASPTFTGTPAAPTAADGTNTTQLATTAFVQTAVGARVSKATFAPWAAASGTAARTTFATYAAPTISNPPTQAEVQAIADHLQILSERFKALIDDLKS